MPISLDIPRDLQDQLFQNAVKEKNPLSQYIVKLIRLGLKTKKNKQNPEPDPEPK